MIIREEETFAQKRTVKFTFAKISVLLVLSSLAILALSFVLITTLLAKWVDPQYQALQTKKELNQMHIKIDSLTSLAETHAEQAHMLKSIINGDIQPKAFVIEVDGSSSIDVDSIDLDEVSPVDSLFRKQFEEVDYEQLTKKNATKERLQQTLFFAPVRGIVTAEFDVKKDHMGTDIVAAKDEPIKATADGTVIMASYTTDSGYVIAVQHRNQLISFYKHNSMLLKKVGDVVKAGDLLAIIGNSGELTEGPHLHFELWFEGNPVNPEDFINF